MLYVVECDILLKNETLYLDRPVFRKKGEKCSKKGDFKVAKSNEKVTSERKVRKGAEKSNRKALWITLTASLSAVLLLVVTLLLFGCHNSKTVSDLHLGNLNIGNMTREEVEANVRTLVGAFSDSEVLLKVEGKNEVKSIKGKDIALEINVKKTAEDAFNFGRGALSKNTEAQYVFYYNTAALTKIIDEFTYDVGGDLREHEVSIDGEYIVLKSGKSGKGISIESAEKAVIESFKPNAKTEASVSFEDASPKEMTLSYLKELVNCEKKEAEYVFENGAVSVTDGNDGIKINEEDAKEKLKNFGEGSADVKIKIEIDEAENTKEDLESKLFRDVLGEYTTKYNAGNVNRTVNVELAAKNISGKILMPGDVFSYNETVGERNAANGFKIASVYEATRVADGMGGGICQTCSTLYPAVLYADLEVLERTNHSLEVSYVPLGMDATVAWGVLDFKFKNSTEYPIIIKSEYGKGSVKVSILGTKEDKTKTVDVITQTVSYTPYTTREVEDLTLQPGEKISESNGFNGSVVNTYKVYYENGKEVKREFLGKNVYRMAEKIFRVGPSEESVETVTPPVDENGNPIEVPGEVVPTPPAVQEEQEPITPEEIQSEYPSGM